jgi:hypothetical protein
VSVAFARGWRACETDQMNHRIGTDWHPQRVITSKVVIAIGFFVAAETASADAGRQQSKFDTLTGECTKVMLMDTLTDPAVCSDQVTAIRSGDETLGYAFVIDSQGNSKPWIMSFSGANLRHDNQNAGTNIFSVYKIYLTINGETNDLAGIGSCVLSNAYGDMPAKRSCSASTIKGSFAAEFVVRHIGSDMSLTDPFPLSLRPFGQTIGSRSCGRCQVGGSWLLAKGYLHVK